MFDLGATVQLTTEARLDYEAAPKNLLRVRRIISGSGMHEMPDEDTVRYEVIDLWRCRYMFWGFELQDVGQAGV